MSFFSAIARLLLGIDDGGLSASYKNSLCHGDEVSCLLYEVKQAKLYSIINIIFVMFTQHLAVHSAFSSSVIIGN
jgi:hypothetical protein